MEEERIGAKLLSNSNVYNSSTPGGSKIEHGSKKWLHRESRRSDPTSRFSSSRPSPSLSFYGCSSAPGILAQLLKRKNRSSQGRSRPAPAGPGSSFNTIPIS